MTPPAEMEAELLIVADEPNAGAFGQCVGDHFVEIKRRSHARFVDDDQGVAANLVEPLAGRIIEWRGGGVTVICGVGQLHEFGHGVGGDVGVFGQNFGGRRGWRQADDGAAAVGPGTGEHRHGGGFSGAGGGERQLQPGSRSGHPAHQHFLSGVELQAILCVLFKHRQPDAGVVGDTAATLGGGVENASFCGLIAALV